ncbi:hypothetical protein [Bathymodiolus thermophilus thioautotrophic gill symbiont]|uniref:Initiator Rep protein domain-containing protein n=1 Tax=Bathymodiolus thermophilus thioautotrophic gill symbiont TaxID=2360 RepID=A0A1J5UKR4_9GAMM|nr:hypothetical protein [Bathymodiolus thermophilus thioautotrophic gill symbiont]AYQ57076.1 hypothetical protein MS2017_1388 [Bathymodiolus thermophilus thioautotrophic gill symbiont]OIR24847.1 hypothetical protein BGC33_04665 [Bathymodiolus thermophilus thioautotrophic gill symbiont]
MQDNALILEKQERAIDALARNNNIIKSLFHYDKPISFLIIALAIQKIKIGAHKEGLVIISRLEIKSLIKGNDLKIGINNLIDLIRKDLEKHNFFNLYSPNSGLQDIRQGLIQKTALTKDLFKDLIVHFDVNMFDVFKSEKNYTIQSLNQLRGCNGNQVTVIYSLTQPYAKQNSPDFNISISDLRLYLRVVDTAYIVPRTLTMRIKQICLQVTKKTDINLMVMPIKKNGTTGTTVGYQFHSEFKKQKNNTQNIKNTKVIEGNKLNIRQQLTEWGVSKEQINTWLNNLSKKTMNNAITQTLNRPKNKKSNAGGYIYKILGSGKQPQLQVQIKANEVANCLKSFGLSNENIERAQDKLKNYNGVLLALANKCLRALANEEINDNNVYQFFMDEVEKIETDLVDK